MKLEEFIEVEFQKALQQTIRALTCGKMIPYQPKAILLGSQSRAGKTTIHRIKQREFQCNIIIIDGDSYRSQHPNYLALQKKYVKDSVDYTKEFEGKMVDHLVDDFSKQGYHLLIEGTLRTAKVPRQTAKLLKSKGYQVSLAVIGIKSDFSFLSTLIRYEELYAIDPNQARATHAGIVENLVDNMKELEREQLFDQIQIYERDRTCIYDSETDDDFATEVLQKCPYGE